MPKGECAMPMGTPCHSEERSDEESFALSQPRGQILRCAQNDKGGVLSMTRGWVRNAKGGMRNANGYSLSF